MDCDMISWSREFSRKGLTKSSLDYCRRTSPFISSRTVMTEPSSSAVIFKKRGSVAGKMRKKEDSDDEDNDKEINSERMSDIKLQQTVRQRKSGASVESLHKLSGNTGKSIGASGEGGTIESVMGTQYTVQIDNGYQANAVPHKKLMDQFIDEKLGLANEKAKKPEKVETAEDLLYKIPEHIKVGASGSKSGGGDAADNGIVPAWSTQLAEVALPISFKMRNIEATERAAAIDAAKAAPAEKNIAAAYRFNAYERAPKLHPSMEGFTQEAGAGAGAGAGQKRPMKSSDDRALDQYKKRQMNHRR